MRLFLIVIGLYSLVGNALRVPVTSISHISSRLKSSQSSDSLDFDGVESSGEVSENPIIRAATVLHRFSRPHTIKGTLLASSMGVTRALIENPNAISLKLVPKAILGLIALLCGNAYIVGINQIYDVKIDEVSYHYLQSIYTHRLLISIYTFIYTYIGKQAVPPYRSQITDQRKSMAISFNMYFNWYNNSKNKIFTFNLCLILYWYRLRYCILHPSFPPQALPYTRRPYYRYSKRILIKFWCILCCKRSIKYTICMESCCRFYLWFYDCICLRYRYNQRPA